MSSELKKAKKMKTLESSERRKTEIQKEIQTNAELAEALNPNEIGTIFTLSDTLSRTKDPRKAKLEILQILSQSGYGAIYSAEQMGFELMSDLRLNGDGNHGRLVVIDPLNITKSQEQFLMLYAKKAAEGLDLIEYKSGLEKAVEEIHDLEGMMTHEIRNPLGTIIGFSGLLAEKEMPKEDLAKYLKKVHDNALHLNHLIGLVELSGMSATSLRENSQETSINELAKETASLNEDFMEQNNLELRYYTNGSTLYNINPAILRGIWGTLTGNALSYALSGTTIRQAVRTTSNNIHIYMENETNGERREGHGQGRGKGFPFVARIAKSLNGNLEGYKERKIFEHDYQTHEHFGIKPEKEVYDPDKSFFGIHLKLPKLKLEQEASKN